MFNVGFYDTKLVGTGHPAINGDVKVLFPIVTEAQTQEYVGRAHTILQSNCRLVHDAGQELSGIAGWIVHGPWLVITHAAASHAPNSRAPNVTV
jgi:hypothetical protein